MLEMLGSLQRQTSKDFEVVIVVEKSKKYFATLRDYLSRTNLNHQLIFSDGLRGISYSRNLGIRRCRGDIIAFTDDDVILFNDWVENMNKAYAKHPEAIGVTGQASPLWIDKSKSWFPMELYWMLGCTGWRGWNDEKCTNIAAGVNMSFRREAFTIAMFKEDMGAGASSKGKLGFPNEDNDFTLEICAETKRVVVFDPKVGLMHKVYPFRVQDRYIMRYAFWQGCAEARYSENEYAKHSRQSLRMGIVKTAILDLLQIGFRKGQSRLALKELRVFILVGFYLSIGYLAFKSGTYRQIGRLI